MNAARALRWLCGATLMLGGTLFCSSSDFAVFPFALLVCLLGLLFVIYLGGRYRAGWSKRVTLLALAGALVAVLAGIVGRLSSTVAYTAQRFNTTGQLIDVVNYRLSYFTDRYGSISAFLLLGLGLFLLAREASLLRSGLAGQRLLTLMAVTSLAIYAAGVVDVYLDGAMPGILTAIVWRLFGLGWIVLGALQIADRQAKPGKGLLHAP